MTPAPAPDDEPQAWEVVSRRLAYDASPWLKHYVETLRLPDGRLVDDFHVVEAREHAVIFAVTDDGQVVTERLYRHAAHEVCAALPAGYIEAGEEPEVAAKRELLEETGYAAREWRHLGSFAVDGNRGMGKSHLFLATGAYVASAQQILDDLEHIAVVLAPLTSVREMVLRGDFRTLTGAAAAAMALLALG
jgi:ADP-ribose pyrophosphatase